MEQLSGKVAVVTGGASGIGFALATRLAAEGAKLVLADVEEPALEKAAAQLAERGTEVLAVRCDVGEAADVEALAAATLERFGAAHVVCNNAGVGGGGFIDEVPLSQWEWLLHVNLWGVIHGVRTFLPILREQDEGHFVNTASILGLVAAPISAPYAVTKFGVVALSEALKLELGLRASKVGVTVVCPGWVATNIHDSERNRPDRFEVAPPADPAAAAMGKEVFRSVIQAGMDPTEVADRAIDAVKENRFYVLTHDGNTDLVRNRMQAILDGNDPPFAMPQ